MKTQTTISVVIIGCIIVAAGAGRKTNSSDDSIALPGKHLCQCIMPSGDSARALIIGINNYSIPQFKNLKAPWVEACSLAYILKKNEYSVIVIPDTEATRQRILYELSNIKRKTKELDRLLISFAGHGMKLSLLPTLMQNNELKQYDPSLKNFNNTGHDELFLVTHQPKDGLLSDVLAAKELVDSLNTFSNGPFQRILLIDACMSANLDDSYFYPVGAYSPRIIDDGFFAITNVKDTTFDGDRQPFLIAGLNGEADRKAAGNGDGCVSAYEFSVFLDLCLRVAHNTVGRFQKVRFVLIGSGEMQLTKY